MTKVIIIGGGFGGVFTAKFLQKKNKLNFDIELICDKNYFVFQPLLPEVAAGTINSQDAVTPIRQLLPEVSVRLATVEDINTEAKTVTILQGRKRILQNIKYDQLVVATGQVTDLSLFPGFLQHSLKMKDLSDAYYLRNHIVQCFELADTTKLPDVKKMALTFVVAGGGFSGVETLGEILEMTHRICKYYPNIEKEEIRAIIIQRGDNLLQEMPVSLGIYAAEQLRKRGATVRLKVGIESASATTVTTTSGEVIDTMTIVTTIGNAASEFIKKLPFELHRGKILVNSNLKVKGFDDIWAVGDAASIPMKSHGSHDVCYAPPTAQFAVQESKLLASNLVKHIDGLPLEEFSYQPKGMLASLGAYKGVAQIGSIQLTGLPAWFIWRFLYIGMLPGFSTRVRVALNWLFDYFMPRTIVQMAHPRTPAVTKVYYRAGELVYDRGELIPGFFIVAKGRFKFSYPEISGFDSGTPNGEVGKLEEKILKPGDHGGNLAIQANSLTQGRLEAEEPGELLFIQREDFKQLCETIPVVQAHFNYKSDVQIKALHNLRK